MESTDGPSFVKALLLHEGKYSIIDVIDGNITWRRGYGVGRVHYFTTIPGVFNGHTIKFHILAKGATEKPSEDLCRQWHAFRRRLMSGYNLIITVHTKEGKMIDINMDCVRLLNIIKKLPPAVIKALESACGDEFAPPEEKLQNARKDEAAKDAEIAQHKDYDVNTDEKNNEPDNSNNEEDNEENSDDDSPKDNNSDSDEDSC